MDLLAFQSPDSFPLELFYILSHTHLKDVKNSFSFDAAVYVGLNNQSPKLQLGKSVCKYHWHWQNLNTENEHKMESLAVSVSRML